MAYDTGTATGVVDLLDKFRLFAIAQGWTVNRNVAAGTGRELCISKGTQFYNFRAYHSENIIINGTAAANRHGIAMNGSDGYSAGQLWDNQPGYPVKYNATGNDRCHANMECLHNNTNFPAYHFFAPNADCLQLELEETSGTFIRLGCGKLDLFNAGLTYGGRYFHASMGEHPSLLSTSSTFLGSDMDSANYGNELVPFRGASSGMTTRYAGMCASFLRVAFDSFDGWAGSAVDTNASFTLQACAGSRSYDFPICDWSPNPINGVGIILPQVISVVRGATALNPVGVLPAIRFMDMTNYQPGAEFAFGGDTWKVFPWYRKGALSVQRGIAYKKVP